MDENWSSGKSFKTFTNYYIFVQFFVILVSRLLSFSISESSDVCFLAGLVYVICWSATVVLSFSFNSLYCLSGFFLLSY